MLKQIGIIFSLLIISHAFLFASDWQRMHGKYVTLEFNPGFEALADSMVNIADRAIPRLAALHGVSLSEFDETKTRIILTDAPDVSNGYAIENDIVIYARSSMYMNSWSGPHTWYKMVLEHELGHHLTFRAIKRTANIFGMLPIVSTPRWFFEGIAQYFAETWTPFRGDLYMKEAVLNGRFSYNSLLSLENGRLLYASGHAYIRYLADQFGDSSLIKLMAYEKDGLFYNFDDAFESVYGKTPASLFPYFARHMIIYYGNKAADYPVLDFTNTLPSFGFRDLQILPLSDADSTYLVSTIKESNHLFITAFIVKIENGNQTILSTISNNVNTKLIVSPDNNFIAYGRRNLGAKFNQTTLNYEWFVYDRKTALTFEATDNVRAINASFTNKNELVLSVAEAGETILTKIPNPHLDNFQYPPQQIFKTPMPIGKVIGLEDGSILFEAQAKSSQRDLYIWKNGKTNKITADSPENRNAIVINEDLIAFNQMIDNNPAIAIMDRNSGKISTKINQQFPLWLHSFDKRKNEIITIHKDAGSNTIFAALQVDSLLKMEIGPEKKESLKKYSSWTKKQAVADSIEGNGEAILRHKKIEEFPFPQGQLINMQTIPLPIYDEKSGAGLFVSSVWLESMQRQILAATGLFYFDNWDDSFLSAIHSIKFFDLNFTTAYYHGPGFITRIDGHYKQLVHDYGVFDVEMKRFINGNPRLAYALNLSYSTDQFSKVPTVNSVSHHGPSIKIGMGYNLPAKLPFIFPKRQIWGSVNYYKSARKDLDFSVLQAVGRVGSNLFMENIGIVSRFNFTKTDGDVPSSAQTGIDQDYSYNIPRDFRNSKAIRGVKKNILGDELLWSSTELSYVLAQNTPAKILIIPVKEVAITAFIDAAQIKNTTLNTSNDVYSFGGEFSFGESFLRFAGGYAQGYLDNKKLNGTFYGRINLIINELY
ncbi:MAG: hypothetical protein D8M58_07870 [Calditrichaeota bacterium]|nr:MAG: hypothetical protein DWQ03_18620 [Calditrichota bacterium]MBL1205298.1 hypothetical protein [Calditrichota bacterium]NOG45127.1 hypothetical protein [Calditrichota bacterium]